jgi:hypothetical protein
MPELTSVKMRISGLIDKAGSSYGRARPSSTTAPRTPSDSTRPSGLRFRASTCRGCRRWLLHKRKALETELPGARVVELPPELAIGAEYGLTLLEAAAASRPAAALALYILSSDGQGILRKHGFDARLLGKE